MYGGRGPKGWYTAGTVEDGCLVTRQNPESRPGSNPSHRQSGVGSATHKTGLPTMDSLPTQDKLMEQGSGNMTLVMALAQAMAEVTHIRGYYTLALVKNTNEGESSTLPPQPPQPTPQPRPAAPAPAPAHHHQQHRRQPPATTTTTKTATATTDNKHNHNDNDSDDNNHHNNEQDSSSSRGSSSAPAAEAAAAARSSSSSSSKQRQQQPHQQQCRGALSSPSMQRHAVTQAHGSEHKAQDQSLGPGTGHGLDVPFSEMIHANRVSPKSNEHIEKHDFVVASRKWCKIIKVQHRATEGASTHPKRAPEQGPRGPEGARRAGGGGPGGPKKGPAQLPQKPA